MTAKIRFATVAYKNSEIVFRLVKSLHQFCEVPFEVVCWDNSERPLSELRELESSGNFTLLGGEGNLGFTRGVNRAAAYCESKGAPPWTDWILINPDAYLDSRITAKILSGLRDLGALCGLRVFSDSEKHIRQQSARSFPGLITALVGREGLLTRFLPANKLSRKYLRTDLATSTSPTPVDWVSGCALYASREIWEKVGGLDERYFLYADDVDLGRTAREKKIPVLFVPWIDVIHESRTSAGKSPWRSDFHHHVGMTKYYWKWASPLGRLSFPLIVMGVCLRFLFRRALGRAGRTST